MIVRNTAYKKKIKEEEVEERVGKRSSETGELRTQRERERETQLWLSP